MIRICKRRLMHLQPFSYLKVCNSQLIRIRFVMIKKEVMILNFSLINADRTETFDQTKCLNKVKKLSTIIPLIKIHLSNHKNQFYLRIYLNHCLNPEEQFEQKRNNPLSKLISFY